MLNFIGRVIPSVASRVLDAYERDRARNDVVIGDKAVSAVRWLECDAQARFCHDGVKVASNWMSNLTQEVSLLVAVALYCGSPNQISRIRSPNFRSHGKATVNILRRSGRCLPTLSAAQLQSV